MKIDTEQEISRKVELITFFSGAGLCLLSLLGLAFTHGQFRPVGFLSLAGVGLIVAVIGLLELRKVRRLPPGGPSRS